MLTFLSTRSVCCRTIPPLFTKTASTANWTCILHYGWFTLARINYLQYVYIELMEALWYRPFTHYEQIPMRFNPSSSSVETISLKSAGFLLEWLSMTQHEERHWELALCFYTAAKHYLYRYFWSFFGTDSDLSTTTMAIYYTSTKSTAKVIFFLILPFYHPQHRGSGSYLFQWKNFHHFNRSR